MAYSECVSSLSVILNNELAINISEYVDDILKHDIFSQLLPSTISALCKFENVSFDEKKIMAIIEPSGRIHKITSNYGEKVSDSFVKKPPKINLTNKGRKKKIHEPSTRRLQGNGSSLNTQVTLWVHSLHNVYKYYKCKIFKNGTVGIPGGLFPSLIDIIDATNVAKDKLSVVLGTDIKIVGLYTILRNYKFNMIDTSKRINLQRLYNILLNMQTNNDPFVSDMYQLILNNERYQGLKLKFPTPTEKNPDKKTTIKIYRSGKINIDGAISDDSARYYNIKIMKIFDKYKDLVIKTIL